ncbi:unnamed protein product [Adineta steineri]|uniref:Uncharacterized protein n=1 Tax=Adineta steineri TaxID=433720 RepID=A0A813NCX6_9BILA|nr:unnamed protein product [Adineta steineri]CAF0749772.1 unnamed protein product [Adineta steineri]CAF3823521.1 unnamed protein product [Adineta steineri]CAF3859409.1 unnamed protein product [Adineta steineri]
MCKTNNIISYIAETEEIEAPATTTTTATTNALSSMSITHEISNTSDTDIDKINDNEELKKRLEKMIAANKTLINEMNQQRNLN